MHPIAAADFHTLVQVGDPRLSPDGERVAFVRQTADDDDQSAVATIHVASADGGEPRQFTVSEGVDSQPRWGPDGEYLAFVSTRGADDDRPQLWVLPTAGGEARQVTEVAGGVAGIEWSPDGSRIVFTQASTPEDREEGRDLSVEPDFEPETPDPRVIDRMNFRSMQQYADGKRNHVYVLDVERAIEAAEAAGDEPAREDALTRLTDGDTDYIGAAWGDDETIYYASKPADEAVPDDSVVLDIYAHPLDADADPEVLTQTIGWGGMIEATTDGLVAFPRTPEERMTMRQVDIVVYDTETGEEVVPTDPLDRTLAHGGGFQWGPDEESLFFATPDEGAVCLWSVPGDASADPNRVYDGRSHVDGFSVGADHLAVTQSEWDHPGDVFLADRSGGDPTRLTDVNADYFAEHAVAEPEELWFESDGAECQGWLLTPPSGVEPADVGDDADTNGADAIGDEPYPLVVEIHGGPHVQWTTSGTMWHEFQTLAANGYAVFWSNPRGSTGYGEDHATATYRDWGDKTLEDVLAGADVVSERPEVDADEQYVTGGSFGGYMTAWAVGRTDRFTAAVAQRGVYDLTGFYGSTDGAYKLVEYDFGATPWEEPQFLWEHSPVSLVPEVDTPTLLVHSDRDYRTPANGAELYYTGLKKHRVDTRLVRYPREGHELSRSGEPGHVVDRIERIVRWFDGYSDRTDVPPALEREPNAGLSAAGDPGEDDEDEGPDGESANDA
ncbi:peptidase S9 prolyl oligopeptidase active site domain-containing protein [Halovivax asiaticus JCM 14624]|uniref:Peptidase S9 prolyl oligopeptidase active site domain-containing protein n=1 Tax=Halovivax asiaticus JCM 14624 TaxID=1227490 RepID=M0BJ58_9EURY|nr:S9 family peptidase [Halovivax asiaticus]ELZ10890.1 peptidase S9 prolyl oligopeptidase active site domain-containing protein [Halovivax asiaticus JCM 14624]